MTKDNKSLSFGRYLRAMRLEKGISLEEVSWETKIGMNILILIEQEDLGKLPREVYAKGFLRAYAKAIDADADHAVQNYLSGLKIYKNSIRSEADFERSDKAFWPRLLLSLGALVGIVVLSIFGLNIFRKHAPVDRHAIKQEMEVKQSVSESQSFEGIDPVDSAKPQTIDDTRQDTTSSFVRVPDTEAEFDRSVSEKFLLKIRAVEKTWMKIIIDNQSPKEYTLNPGDLLALEASSGYNLLIGNAGGVELNLNNQAFEVPGKSGQVVNIQIP
jgi:cytoskeletal protein RodZ